MNIKSLFLSLVLSTSLFANDYTVVEDQSSLRIATPSLSARKTGKLRLKNGLEVYLISDPGTHESGAALAVEVGTWDDPAERPGMAHFVEHMLFMGNEKYPDESEYQRFLDEHGGNQNAFTAADRTAYIFSVANDGFEGALDRFAQFFIAPLFNPSGVARESEAIDQEFCKNVPLDFWRAFYVKKELANKDHPCHRFCIGNRETLSRISHDELMEWYYDHYSANLMHLVVHSALPLEELQEQVASIFSKIKNKEKSPDHFQMPLHSMETMGKVVAIAPMREIQRVELTWELPVDFARDKEVHADDLTGYILGHEGVNSLLAQLKREQLAESLACGRELCGRDQHCFTISVNLTAKGVKEYETVIERCFEAIAALQESSIPKYVFEEIQRKNGLEYTFQQRKDLFKSVTQLVVQMTDEPLETFPEKSLLPTQFDERKINQFLELLTPKECHFTLIANPQISRIRAAKKERWIGAHYGLLPIDEKKLDSWAKLPPNQEIRLPSPNRFLPENLALVKSERKEESPRLIYEKEFGRVYHCCDSRFLVPEITWYLTLKTPEIKGENAKSTVLADLYCHAVEERLSAYGYEAKLGGLSYDLSPTHNGLILSIKGYSEKASELLAAVLAELKETHPALEEFQLYKSTLQREYGNRAKASPIAQGFDLLWSALYKEFTPPAEKAEIIPLISYDDFMLFSNQIWKVCYIEGTFYGNLSEEEAIALFDQIDKELEDRHPYPPALHPKVMLAALPSGKDPAYLARKSSLPGNVVILTLDCGRFSFQREAALQILAKGLEEPFFSELRTKQQTGYLVANLAKEIERHLYSFFLVQSSSHDTRDLLARFELFLETSLQQEHLITEERFESIRASLINSLENSAENMPKMGNLYHTLAFEYDGEFDWLEKRISGLKELSYAEFQGYAREFLGKENKKRLAVCVNGALPKKERFRYRHIANPQTLRKELTYQDRSA